MQQIQHDTLPRRIGLWEYVLSCTQPELSPAQRRAKARDLASANNPELRIPAVQKSASFAGRRL